MKKIISLGTRSLSPKFTSGRRVVAVFGTARLVRQPDGRHVLEGGSAADCTDAREWCSLFAPTVVFGAARRGEAPFVITA